MEHLLVKNVGNNGHTTGYEITSNGGLKKSSTPPKKDGILMKIEGTMLGGKLKSLKVTL